MASNVLARLQSNRNLAGPDFGAAFDTRIVNGLNVSPSFRNQGRTPGLVPFPGGGGASMNVQTGRGALTVLAVAVLALVGFNVWTHEFQK